MIGQYFFQTIVFKKYNYKNPLLKSINQLEIYSPCVQKGLSGQIKIHFLHSIVELMTICYQSENLIAQDDFFRMVNGRND